MIDFRAAYISKLAGIAKYKNDKEIWWEHDQAESWNYSTTTITIEFIQDSYDHNTVREYRDDGSLIWAYDYRDGVENGKGRMWNKRGELISEELWKNGKMMDVWWMGT